MITTFWCRRMIVDVWGAIRALSAVLLLWRNKREVCYQCGMSPIKVYTDGEGEDGVSVCLRCDS